MNATAPAHSTLAAANEEIATLLIPAMLFVAILMVVGIVGNLLVCFVFFFRLRMTTQNFLIVALAVFDLLSCFIAMPTEIVDMRYFLTFDNEFACRLLTFIHHFCALSSILVLNLIAVDRYRKVCHPFGRQMSVTHVKVALVLVMFMALLLSVPAVILYGIRTTDLENVTAPARDCSISNSMRHTVYPKAYVSVLYCIFFFSLITLFIAYVTILRAIKRHMKHLRKISATKKLHIVLKPIIEVDSQSIVLDRRVELAVKGQGDAVGESAQGFSESGRQEKSGRGPAMSTVGTSSGFTSFSKETSRYTVETVEMDDLSSVTDQMPTEPNPFDDREEAPQGDQDQHVLPAEDEITWDVRTPEDWGRHDGALSSILYNRNRIHIDGVTQKHSVEWKTESASGTARRRRATCGRYSRKSVLKAKRHQATAIALVITPVFFFSFMPYLALITVKLFQSDFDRRLKGATLVLYSIFFRSFFIYTMSNPIIYGVLKKNFRVECFRLFHRIVSCKKCVLGE